MELLARTGIRKSELLALTVDAIVQIGSAFCLRIPIGKLHYDRYIPLHPELKDLLDDWVTNHRPTGLRSDRPLLERNRPISSLRVSRHAQLRSEMHRRMLGNGYCTRPVDMDCHFESICESCTFFVTTIETRPTLQRQREDAANKGQVGRIKAFDGLLDRLDNDAS